MTDLTIKDCAHDEPSFQLAAKIAVQQALVHSRDRLTSIPVELLLTIILYLGQATEPDSIVHHLRMRLVCKRLMYLVSPALFRTLRWRRQYRNADADLKRLKIFSMGPAASCVQKISILLPRKFADPLWPYPRSDTYKVRITESTEHNFCAWVAKMESLTVDSSGAGAVCTAEDAVKQMRGQIRCLAPYLRKLSLLNVDGHCNNIIAPILQSCTQIVAVSLSGCDYYEDPVQELAKLFAHSLRKLELWRVTSHCLLGRPLSARIRKQRCNPLQALNLDSLLVELVYITPRRVRQLESQVIKDFAPRMVLRRTKMKSNQTSRGYVTFRGTIELCRA